MQRAGLIALLAALLLAAATLQAQTSGMQFGGIRGSAGISRGSAARAGRRGGRERVVTRSHRHHNGEGEGYAGFYPSWYGDYYDDYGEPPEAYAPPEPQAPPGPMMMPPMMPPQPERIPSPPKMTEIPQGRTNAARPLPPAVFILTNGERLESGQYLLTSDHVQLTMDRRQQSIPLDQLDLKATLAANRERGIDLHIPNSGSVISLGF